MTEIGSGIDSNNMRDVTCDVLRIIVLGTVAYADRPVLLRVFQAVQNGTATEVKVIVDPRQVEQWTVSSVSRPNMAVSRR